MPTFDGKPNPQVGDFVTVLAKITTILGTTLTLTTRASYGTASPITFNVTLGSVNLYGPGLSGAGAVNPPALGDAVELLGQVTATSGSDDAETLTVAVPSLLPLNGTPVSLSGIPANTVNATQSL